MKKFFGKYLHRIFLITIGLVAIVILNLTLFKILLKYQDAQKTNTELRQSISGNEESIRNLQSETAQLKGEDLRKTNDGLKLEIDNIKKSFKSAVGLYEQILILKEGGSTGTSMESKLSSILNFLSQDNLPSAQKTGDTLLAEINKEKAKQASQKVAAIPANVPEISGAPASGYRRQKVTVGDASFLVDIISADLNSTKVIVDTASDSTCGNNCPVLPLATYVSRSNAYAGINGTYFCPETYPSCVDKKNAFDILVMNKNKVYFNSDNNVYSSVPAAIFSGNSARFVGKSSEWGRDTGVDAVIANRPLLMLDGNLMFGAGGEDKETIKSNRSFLGASGSTAYIGVVHSATVAESAKVLQAMGIRSAINLDSGGSTALWSGGYKVGPGRNLPNVVLFVRR